jgi:hypothetical protein
MSISQISLSRASLTIWGDAVVGRALMLLLRSSGYEVKFLPAASSLAHPLPLKGSSLLVLAPTPQVGEKERQAFLGSLRNTSEAATIPVLELGMPGEETQEESAKRDASWHYVPWPCRSEELEEWIVAVVSLHCGELEAKELGALRARS